MAEMLHRAKKMMKHIDELSSPRRKPSSSFSGNKQLNDPDSARIEIAKLRNELKTKDALIDELKVAPPFLFNYNYD